MISMPKFDSKAYVKNRLLLLIKKYCPIDHINLRSKRSGFELAENTLLVINNAEEIISDAESRGDKFPKSTANIIRYGVILINIFNNLEDYMEVNILKGRTRRGHKKDIAVTDFDLKKIELLFKKSSLPFKVKTVDDDKLIKAKTKEYNKFLEEANVDAIKKDSKVYQNYFVIENSEGFEFFRKINRLADDLSKEIKLIKQKQIDLLTIQEESKNLEKTLQDAIKNKTILEEKIKSLKAELGIKTLLNNKEELINDPNIALFFRILSIGIDRYIRRMENKENITLDNKKELLDIALNPTKSPYLNKEHWKGLIEIFEQFGLELLQGKSWFTFETNDELKQFLTSSDLLTTYSQIRKLESEMDNINIKVNSSHTAKELQQIENLINNQDINLKKIDQVKEEIIDCEKRKKSLFQDLKDALN